MNRVEPLLGNSVGKELDVVKAAARARAERVRSRFHVTLLCSEAWLRKLVVRSLRPPLVVAAFSMLDGRFLWDVSARSSIVILHHSPPEVDLVETSWAFRKLDFFLGLPKIVLEDSGSSECPAGVENFGWIERLEVSNIASDLESMVRSLIPQDPGDERAN